MSKPSFFCVLLLMTIVAACGKESPDPTPQVEVATEEATPAPVEAEASAVKVTPLLHSSFILEWNGKVIVVDPTKAGLANHTGGELKADVILITDFHPDHLDTDAIAQVRADHTEVVAPPSSIDKAGSAMPEPTSMSNGEQKQLLEGTVGIEATPMYNLVRKREETGELFHVKGRGNGYVLTFGEERVYISGDTECIPEMKALKDIDVAFVCMNLPYTMPVEEAAECIKEFKPRTLIPFHYRGQDPKKLDALLEGSGITIKYMEWYPAAPKTEPVTPG